MRKLANYSSHHRRGGRFIKDIVYAANDGIITTFAVVAGVAGASLPQITILILGFANVLADGFSMAASNYLGTKSEKEVYKKEEGVEMEAIEKELAAELKETKNILKEKGYEGEDLENLLALISKNKEFWIDFMLREEINSSLPSKQQNQFLTAGLTFVSFALAGSLTLIPFILFGETDAFKMSVMFTSLTLFVVGAARSFYTNRNFIFEGSEMFLIGGVAASISYGIGHLLKELL